MSFLCRKTSVTFYITDDDLILRSSCHASADLGHSYRVNVMQIYLSRAITADSHQKPGNLLCNGRRKRLALWGEQGVDLHLCL